MRLTRTVLSLLVGVALLVTSAPALASLHAFAAGDACGCPMHRAPVVPTVQLPCSCEEPTPEPPAPVASAPPTRASDHRQVAAPLVAPLPRDLSLSAAERLSALGRDAARGPPDLVLAALLRC